MSTLQVTSIRLAFNVLSEQCQKQPQSRPTAEHLNIGLKGVLVPEVKCLMKILQIK